MVFHYPLGPGSTVGADFSFRDNFQAVPVSDGPVFSKGRISPTTERPVATLVMLNRNADGRFDGAVATNLELQRLTQTLVVIGQAPDQGMRATVLDATSQIIARSQPRCDGWTWRGGRDWWVIRFRTTLATLWTVI